MKYKIYSIILLLSLNAVLMAQEIHHIDLGLTVEWGECNIGAENPWDKGMYFAWGETVSFGNMDTTNTNNYTYTSSYSKNKYTYETYKWYAGKDSILPSIPFFPYFSKYCNNEDHIFNHRINAYDHLKALEENDDAAKATLGGQWRMPTQDEIQELAIKCTWEWTQVNDVPGYKVVSKINGNSIFLPVTGFRVGDKLEGEHLGYYWSRTLSSANVAADALLIDEQSNRIVEIGRFIGSPIRPVWAPK